MTRENTLLVMMKTHPADDVGGTVQPGCEVCGNAQPEDDLPAQSLAHAYLWGF